MAFDLAPFMDNAAKITAALATLATVGLGAFTFRGRRRIKQLEQEIEQLKKKVHRATSKVDPESDRRLIMGAEESIQIMGINALAPLHHAREEIIAFLRARRGGCCVLLLDPESGVFKKREEQEHDAAKRILTEWKASLTILKDIETAAENRIELRLRSDPPDRSLLIIDGEGPLTTNSRMLINYYPDQPGMRGYSGGQFLAEYALERDRDSFYKNSDYFNDCWQRAAPTDLDQAIARYIRP